MPLPPRLHAVADDRVLALNDYTKKVADIARQGNVALHVRSRSLGGRDLSHLVSRTVGAARGAYVMVNDRADVALTSQVHGLHLPANGLTIAAARSILGPKVWIGRSTHSAAEAREALADGADYVFLGPIWKTTSHPERSALGPETLRPLSGLRVVAIGGITTELVQVAVDSGAWGVAAISSIWEAPHSGATVQRMLLSLVP